MCRRRIGSFLMVVLALAAAIPARADTGPWPDHDDSRGPLSMRGIEIGHRRYGGGTTIDVVFEGPVSPQRLKVGDFFGIQLDGKGDGRGDAIVFGVAGPRGWHVFTEGSIPPPGMRRVAPDVVRVTLSNYSGWLDADRGGYRFRLASYSETGAVCAEGCWDFIPNSSWLVHDWTEPVIERFSVPEITFPQQEGTSIPVAARVTDRGGAGPALWTLWRRGREDESWTSVRSGYDTRIAVSLDARQGEVVDLKLTARDGAGNRAKIETARTRVPVDDTTAMYDATYFGFWEEQAHEDTTFGSVHMSTTPLETFSFSGTGRFFCIGYRIDPSYGVAIIEIDGEEKGALSQFVRNDAGFGCADAGTEGLHTAEVHGGAVARPFNIDSFWIE